MGFANMKKIIYIILIIFFILISIPDNLYNSQALEETLKGNFINREQENRPELPAVIIMYDDGNIQDYTEAFPVHQKYDVPGVVAVNPGYIGYKNKLDLGHLLIMKNHGWEVANHGYYHAALIYNSVTVEPEIEADHLYVNNPYLVEKKYNYILFNSEKNIREKIKIKDFDYNESGQRYLKLTDSLKNNYPLERTYIMPDKEAMNNEVVESKNVLENWGLNIDTFVYPYNGNIEPAVEIVKENYNIARGGRRIGQPFPDAFINEEPFTQYSLKGVGFENNILPEESMTTLLETIVDKKALLVMYAHTNQEHFSVERLERIIEKAKEMDIDIITFSDLKYF